MTGNLWDVVTVDALTQKFDRYNHPPLWTVNIATDPKIPWPQTELPYLLWESFTKH